MDSNKILYTTIHLMETVELVKDMTGEEKKQYVLNELKKILNIETYERYEPFIEIFMIIIINISKGLKLKINKTKYCF